MKKLLMVAFILLSLVTPIQAQAPATCQITGTIYDLQGNPAAGIRLLITPMATPGVPLSNAAFPIVSGVNGAITPINLIRGSVVRIEGRALGYSQSGGRTVQIPDASSATLADLQDVGLIFGSGIKVKVAGVLMPNFIGTLDFVSGATITQSPTGEANITITPAGANLNDLNDVTINSPATGQYPRFNGTVWGNSAIQASDLPSSIDAAKLGGGQISNSEFAFLDGVSSNIQTQINAKASVFHQHGIADVTGLQSALDGKQAAHAISNLLVGPNLQVTGGTGAVIGTGVNISLSPVVTVLGNATTGSDALVRATSPTIANPIFTGAPTIPSFASAQHTHQNGAGGGQLNASNIFNAGTVPVNRLPLMIGDSGSGGTAGLVPAPGSGDAVNCLRGDGTWGPCGDSGGAGAPVGAFYLVTALNGGLDSERRLIAGAGLASNDGGANADFSLSIATGGVTDLMLRNSVGLSVIGRSANSTGVPADIVAASDGQILRRVSGVLGFGAIDDSLVPDSITLTNITQITNRAYSDLQGVPSSFTPSSHAASHQSGGSDALALGSIAGNLSSLQHGDLSSVDTSSPRHHWNQITNKPGTFAPSAHATSHQDGGSDEVATATPGANAIPKAGAGGTLADGWLSANVSLFGASVDLGSGEASGTLAASRFPALTGDATTSAGSLNVSVVRLRGILIPSGTPGDGQVIKYNQSTGEYEFADDQTGAGGSGITELNGLTPSVQSFAVGSSGSDFGIASSGSTHTFNIPSMAGSGVTRGLLTNAVQSIPGAKTMTGKFTLAGALVKTPRVVTATGDLLATDQRVDADHSAPIILTLPALANVDEGFEITVTDVSGDAVTNNITLQRRDSDQIAIGSNLFTSIQIVCNRCASGLRKANGFWQPF